MIKKTLSTVALLALAGCQQQEPAASPPPAGPAPAAPPEAAAPAPSAPATTVATLPPATADERAKWFTSCWGLFNAKDWQRLSACYAENATSEQVDQGFPTMNGRNDIIEKSMKPYVGAFSDGT